MSIITKILDKLRQNGDNFGDMDLKRRPDKYLESLRRERQTQLEEEEKKRLKIVIAAYKQEKMRKELYGIVEKKGKKPEIISKVRSRFL